MRETAETVRDVGVQHPLPTPVGFDPDHLKSLVSRAPRAEPEARRQEVRLEDRFEDDLRRRHDHPVANGGDGERPILPRLRLRDVDSPQRGRSIALPLECCGDLREELVDPGLLDGVDRDPVRSRSPSVCTDLAPGPLQDVAAGDVLIQGMEAAVRVLLGTAVKHALQGSRFLHPFGPCNRARPRGPPVRTVGVAGGPSPIPGTHQVSSLVARASMKQGPSHHRRLCCPRGSSGTTAPPTPSRLPRPFPIRL